MSIVISILSLCISILTAWSTLFRRGSLAMTKPNIVFFGFDDAPKISAKVFLRTLLYSTAVKGQVVEGMFVKLHDVRGEQVFSFWGYGETKQLVPGSGLYVGQMGVAANHHFVLSAHQSAYEFTPGEYTIEIFARLVGKQHPIKLHAVSVYVTEEHASILAQRGGVLFEIKSDGREYVASAQEKHSKANNHSPEKIIQALDELSRRHSALPVLDTRSIDEIIGYDEFGVPR
jgi:hypothetical protein